MHRLVRALPFLEDELTLLARFVPRGSVCIDVGAANGVYTTVLSRLAGPAGRVYSFEPQPASFRLLAAGRALLRLRNVDARRVAVSDEPGPLVMLVPRRRLPVHGRAFVSRGATLTSDDLAEFRAADRLEVDTVTLDGLGLQRLDFVKCDVEGGELAVLRSGEGMLLAHRPVLLLEVEARHTRKYGYAPAELFAWLAARGYAAHVLDGARLRRVDRVDGAHRNYLFRPS